MIYLTFFLCYLIVCGIIALYELMQPNPHPSQTQWLHVFATPGLLFFVAIITSLVWISGKIRGK